MGDLLNDPVALDEAEAGARSEVDSPLQNDGKTAQGNDPRLEMHYQTELDPQRALPPNGYPYLDRLEREKAEIRRAAVEDRDPDLDNPGPYSGSPLRSAAQLNNPMNVVQAESLAFAKPAMVLDEDALPPTQEEIDDESADNDSSDPSDSGSGTGDSEGSGSEGVAESDKTATFDLTGAGKE